MRKILKYKSGDLVFSNRKAFASIEVMVIALICSMIVTILMDNSFQMRSLVERRYDLIAENLNEYDEEEKFLNSLIKRDVINSENIEEINITEGNLKISYDSSKKAVKISNKNKENGVYKHIYYDYRIDTENKIILNRRRYYEFTN